MRPKYLADAIFKSPPAPFQSFKLTVHASKITLNSC